MAKEKKPPKTANPTAAPTANPTAAPKEASESAQAQQSPQGVFRLKGQYISDLSFECPQPPATLGQYKNNLQLDVGVQTRTVDAAAGDIEVTLNMRGHNQTDEGKTIYLLELKFSGLFTLKGLTAEQHEALLGVDAPALVYPYARQVFMSTILSSGFQPPLLEPINFAALYMQARQQQAAS